MIGWPGGEHHWQLLAEGRDVMVPWPGSGHSLQVEVGDTGEARVLNEQIVEVIPDKDVVEIRRGMGQ